MSYTTELRGDGQTRRWTVHHNLGTYDPTVHIEEVTTSDIQQVPTFAYPSDGELVIEFRKAPPMGTRYCVTISAHGG